MFYVSLILVTKKKPAADKAKDKEKGIKANHYQKEKKSSNPKRKQQERKELSNYKKV